MKDKVKPHFLHIDFSRWVDEDYEEEDPEAQQQIDPSMFMNMANGFGGNIAADYGDEGMMPQLEGSSSSDEEDAEGHKAPHVDDLPLLED